MRDNQIYSVVNQGVGKLASHVDRALGQVARDLSELSSYMVAETIKRQVLEEILFEKSKLLGGLDKQDFEDRFKKKMEEYQEKAKKAREEQVAAMKKAQEEQSSKPKLFSPDGTPLESKPSEPLYSPLA